MTKLPLAEAEQDHLPGVPSLPLPLWTEVPDRGVAPFPALGWWQDPGIVPSRVPPPGPDQLWFGAAQEPLTERPGGLVQLPLLDDPAPWDCDPAAPAPGPRKRRGRRRRKTAHLLSPGQMSLFPQD